MDADAVEQQWELVDPKVNAPGRIRSPSGKVWQVYGAESLYGEINALQKRVTALETALREIDAAYIMLTDGGRTSKWYPAPPKDIAHRALVTYDELVHAANHDELLGEQPR